MNIHHGLSHQKRHECKSKIGLECTIWNLELITLNKAPVFSTKPSNMRVDRLQRSPESTGLAHSSLLEAYRGKKTVGHSHLTKQQHGSFQAIQPCLSPFHGQPLNDGVNRWGVWLGEDPLLRHH